MDVVYVVGRGERNEELRFSLRSLRHLPHGTVWIAGFIPSWVTGVGRIEVEQGKDRYRNGTANLEAACRHPGVSPEFVYFNDDFFVLRPVDEVPTFHRGPLADLATIRRPKRGPSYRGGRFDTYHLLVELGYPEPVAYEPLHTPIRFHQDRMLTTRALGQSVPALHYRTLYGNQHAIGGTLHPNVKISDAHSLPPAAWAFTSTSERAFTHGRVGALLRRLFPDPSPYER